MDASSGQMLFSYEGRSYPSANRKLWEHLVGSSNFLEVTTIGDDGGIVAVISRRMTTCRHNAEKPASSGWVGVVSRQETFSSDILEHRLTGGHRAKTAIEKRGALRIPVPVVRQIPEFQLFSSTYQVNVLRVTAYYGVVEEPVLVQVLDHRRVACNEVRKEGGELWTGDPREQGSQGEKPDLSDGIRLRCAALFPQYAPYF